MRPVSNFLIMQLSNSRVFLKNFHPHAKHRFQLLLLLHYSGEKPGNQGLFHEKICHIWPFLCYNPIFDS